ncbi:NIPSNAP family protein [Williamsia maris]|uniref:NIPSNAP protein n=1 Tax=Williamsia maris TaxID=72806 RepID=A0ABT1HFE5_9NOCA|nr:NIPSNAP family protein [Williamsia maris]MCP2176433.1 NIPSNAP protein [Williamsia maris]
MDLTTPPEISGEDVSDRDQAIRYELATLAYRLPDTERAIAGIAPWVESAPAGGTLVGAWQSEHGVLGRAHVLRMFASTEDVAVERERARRSGAAFGAGPHLSDLTMTTYAPFPFMPPVRPGHYGSVYEMRDYHLIPGGLPPSIDGWRVVLPGRHRVDPIAVVMYAVDGPDRIIQIWPFAGMDDRLGIRRRLVEDDMWPPPGGPEHIRDAVSEMWIPLDFSPLH